MAIDCEPDASPSSAGYPLVSYRDNSSSVLSNVLEHRLREIKMLLRRIAPTACIVGEGVVRWAKIGSCDHNGAGQAPFGVINTLNLIARPTAQTVVEQSRAQGCSVRSITLAIQIPIATSPTHSP